MKIKFSKAYKPLFELLGCWDIVKDPEFKSKYTQEQKSNYLALSKVDTVSISGGRDSGKTFSTSTWCSIAAKDYGHRIMYTRYTMSSTDHSISKSIDERIELLGSVDDFHANANHYKSKKGKGEIVVTGQKTSSNKQTAKMKGLEDFTIFITDEAEELPDYEDWDKARKSIRGKDLQCLSILIFNPPTREHFIYEELFEEKGVAEGFCGIKDNVLYIHTTYMDNYDHLAEHNKRDYELLKNGYDEYEALNNDERDKAPKKLKKKWVKYKHIVLGGFLDNMEGVIYEDWEIGEFDKSLPFIYGLDFGFSDPNALVKIAINHNERIIYVEELLFKNSLGTNELGTALINLVGYDGLIIADSQHNMLINDLYNLGLNIKRCRKGRGSVLRSIKALQSYTIVCTKESVNAHKALNNYIWHDKKAEVPRNEYKHIPDAIAYSAMELIEY